MDLAQLHRLLGVALGAGAVRHSLSHYEWDIAGRCQAPVTRELYARPEPAHSGSVAGVPVRLKKAWINVQSPFTAIPSRLVLHVRCRKCEPCKRMRRAMWAQRAVAETKASYRTWLVTLTLRPDEHYRMLCRAELRNRARGVEWHTLDDNAKFAARCREIGIEITLWLKRLRKQSGAKLRYLLVAEAHTSGLPHYHMLVHEVSDSTPVRKRLLKSWPMGFSDARLVRDTAEAAYLCKYLSKEAAARVRASLGYGNAETPPNAIGNATVVSREENSPLERRDYKVSNDQVPAF